MIRKAEHKDIEKILDLLVQVCNVHADIRPDIFNHNMTKYTADELDEIMKDDTRPIFVLTDDSDAVLGYCFCMYEEVKGSHVLKDMKTMYIDDICVDEASRGQHVASRLFEYATAEAKKNGCYRVTLNVWEGNDNALAFYQSRGMKTLKTMLEYRL